MNLRQLYETIVRCGVRVDPRTDKRSIKEFADTALLYGDPARRVSSVLVGIDVDVAELLLADRLRSRLSLDAVISHHPSGGAFASLDRMIPLQADVLSKVGAGRDISEGFLNERGREVRRRILPANHLRSVDAARLLDMPFLCCHTPADNHAWDYVRRKLARCRPKRLDDIVALLLKEPEYDYARRIGMGPVILLGSKRSACGKVLVEMTGGTSGHPGVYKHLYDRGVRTLVCMHMSDEHLRKVAEARLQVVIAGHIASDTLGMNLLFDALQRQGACLQIHSCSGYQRFARV